jgi:hypothetical protein
LEVHPISFKVRSRELREFIRELQGAIARASGVHL